MNGALHLLRGLHSPMLEPCWTDDGFDWDRAVTIQRTLSGGEQAVLELARSLAGQATCNVFFQLSRIDGLLKDRYADAVRILIDELPR